MKYPKFGFSEVESEALSLLLVLLLQANTTVINE